MFESAALSFKLLRNGSDTEFLGGGRGEAQETLNLIFGTLEGKQILQSFDGFLLH